MATTIVDGTTYTIPENGARGWGTEVTNLLKALGDNSLLIKGGSIPLTSEADFGANFGLKAVWFASRTGGTPAADGVLRLANTDSIQWRNTANDNQLELGMVGDFIAWEGVNLLDASTSQSIVNKNIDASLNALSEIDTTMWASGVLLTATDLTGASNTNVPSALAIKTYVDDAVSGQDDAAEITYTPTTPADWPDPDPTNVQEGLDKNASRLVTAEAHIASTSNPHSVTATQLGLGNVDNTADADKPVSTATQTALDGKEDDLGNPAADGYVLSSTTGGVRSWVAQSGGGGGGSLTTDLSSSNVNVGLGDTLSHPFLIIDTGDTFDITGRLLVADVLTINGTLQGSGDTIVYNLV